MSILDRVSARIRLPEALVRLRAKRALASRLRSLRVDPDTSLAQRRSTALAALEEPSSPAGEATPLPLTDLPVSILAQVLGEQLHPAMSIWPKTARNIEDAVGIWAQQVAERADLRNGQRVLEVGVLPGAISGWATSRSLKLDLTTLSVQPSAQTRSSPRRTESAAHLAKETLEVFAPKDKFDRILAIEPFGRAADPRPLLRKMLSWLAPDGQLFLQTPCHWQTTYHFAPGDEHRWMLPGTPDGAIFPGEDLLADIEDRLPVLARWEVSGEHYERTARAWVQQLNQITDLLGPIPSRDRPEARLALLRWRNAALAQAVMYGFREGQEWCVTQLLLGPDSAG